MNDIESMKKKFKETLSTIPGIYEAGRIVMLQRTLLPDEFLVRCYEDNQLCYYKGEVYIAKLVEQPNIIRRLFPQYSDKLLRVWYHGSVIRDGKREGMNNDVFVSPCQRGNIFAIGNFERIS